MYLSVFCLGRVVVVVLGIGAITPCAVKSLPVCLWSICQLCFFSFTKNHTISLTVIPFLCYKLWRLSSLISLSLSLSLNYGKESERLFNSSLRHECCCKCWHRVLWVCGNWSNWKIWKSMFIFIFLFLVFAYMFLFLNYHFDSGLLLLFFLAVQWNSW